MADTRSGTISIHALYRCLTMPLIPTAVALKLLSPASAEPSAQQSASPQPSVPKPLSEPTTRTTPPVIPEIIETRRPPLDGHKRARVTTHRVRIAHRHRHFPPIERPALAGVVLVAPLPPTPEPPHVTVPTPAYPLDTIAAALTTPPPPIVCRHVARRPDMPDPHLAREQTVACEPDLP